MGLLQSTRGLRKIFNLLSNIRTRFLNAVESHREQLQSHWALQDRTTPNQHKKWVWSSDHHHMGGSVRASL